MTKKKTRPMLIILFMIYVCLSAGGLILFKLGSKDLALDITVQHFQLQLSWTMLLGILCYGCSFVLWLVIVNAVNLSYAMPLSVGLVNMLVLLGSWLVLHENISVLQWVGTMVIIVGLFIINMGG